MLKCPFCHNEVKFVGHRGYGNGMIVYYYRCTSPFCELEFVSYKDKNKIRSKDLKTIRS